MKIGTNFSFVRVAIFAGLPILQCCQVNLQFWITRPILKLQRSNFTIIFLGRLSRAARKYIFDFWPWTNFGPILIYTSNFFQFFYTYCIRNIFEGQKSKMYFLAALDKLSKKIIVKFERCSLKNGRVIQTCMTKNVKIYITEIERVKVEHCCST